MASEDSVDNNLLRDPSMLAVAIDHVGKPHEPKKTFQRPMTSVVYGAHRCSEDLVIIYTRRKAHVPPEERHNHVVQDASIGDLQHEHVGIARLRKDASGAKLLRSHFQEASSVPVLIEKELRLDEVAEGGARMSFHRYADTPFALDEAG